MRQTIIIVEQKRGVWPLRKCWEICDYITSRWIKYNDCLAVCERFLISVTIAPFRISKFEFFFKCKLHLYKHLCIRVYYYTPYLCYNYNQLLSVDCVSASNLKNTIKCIGIIFQYLITAFKQNLPHLPQNCIFPSICTTKNILIGMYYFFLLD